METFIAPVSVANAAHGAALQKNDQWKYIFPGSVVAERLTAPNSNSGVSDQQSVSSNPQPWHLCP